MGRRKKKPLPPYIPETFDVICYSYRWRFEVKPSQILDSGNGVFSTQNIPKGTLIGFYTGRVRFQDQVSIYPGYLLHVSDHVFIDGGYNPRNVTVMINDAHRSPYKNNCEFYYFGTEDEYDRDCVENTDEDGEIQVVPLIGIKTTADIKDGEELFLCYGPDYW